MDINAALLVALSHASVVDVDYTISLLPLRIRELLLVLYSVRLLRNPKAEGAGTDAMQLVARGSASLVLPVAELLPECFHLVVRAEYFKRRGGLRGSFCLFSKR